MDTFKRGLKWVRHVGRLPANIDVSNKYSTLLFKFINWTENKSFISFFLKILSPNFGAVTLSIMTLSITTLSITTLSITTLSIMGLFATLSLNDTA